MDLRSIALARIFIGFCLLINFLICADSLTAFYTDIGVMPRSALPIKFAGVRHFSLNVLSGEYWYQLLLICVGISSSILMMLGAYSRYAIFISWIIFLSFYNRNPIVVDGGDDALKIFLFLFCFLPSATYFSIDQKVKARDFNLNLAGCMAFVIQLGSIYFFSAILKTSPQWRVDGSALHYALGLGVFTSWLGEQLLKFPSFLKYLTITTWYTELIVPLFLLIPIFRNFFRTIVFTTFVSFHIGLALFMDLGLFPYIMISIWLALIPTWIWELKLGQSLSDKITEYFESFSSKFRTNQLLEATFKSNIFSKLLCILFTVYITLWNIRGTDFSKFSPYFSSKLNFIGYSIRIDQHWALFAPRPTQDGGWDIALGMLKNKTSINPKNGALVDFKRPLSTANHYRNFRWKKYVLNTWQKSNSGFRKHYANYLCKKWNSTHFGPYALEEVKIIFMLEKTLPPNTGVYRTFPQPHVTWQQKCPSSNDTPL